MRCLPALACALFALAAPAGAVTKAEESLAVCDKIGGASNEERLALAARGLELAEEAIKGDEQDPKAHYAVFCNLGRQIELARINSSTISSLKRVRREVERALELKPDYVDALMGKGSLLVNTPRLLGGNATEGEKLLRRAVELDPDHIDAHIQLAKALASRGARDEARSEARKALELAEARQQAQAAKDARAVLAKLD